MIVSKIKVVTKSGSRWIYAVVKPLDFPKGIVRLA
jgi:hypothetical protein